MKSAIEIHGVARRYFLVTFWDHNGRWETETFLTVEDAKAAVLDHCAKHLIFKLIIDGEAGRQGFTL